MPNPILGKVESARYEHGYTVIRFVEGSTRTLRGKVPARLTGRTIIVSSGPRGGFGIFKVTLIGDEHGVQITHRLGALGLGQDLDLDNPIPMQVLVNRGLEIAMPLTDE